MCAETGSPESECESEALVTPRLVLEAVTLAIVEATFRGDRSALEALVGAKIPAAWPGRALIERAFCASIDDVRADPDTRLWGDRLMIARDDDGARIVVGSVIFHGRPPDGEAEIGYGVEERWQRNGFGSEATSACVEWALREPGIHRVSATTPPWHLASIRVLEKSGFCCVGPEEHEMLGEVLRFERRKGP
jgi:RimJ/RimL family protein N-acetyltransferase